MNKLVSKNPVWRFKQGKKIQKGYDGLKTKYQYYYLNPDTGHVGIRRDSSSGADNDVRLTHRYIFNGKQYGSFNGGKNYYELMTGRPLSQKANNQLLNLIDRGKKKSIPLRTTTPRFLSKYANMANTIGGASNIKSWQEKLKNYYTPGTYNPDSIWGANTQAAYDRYLADQVKQNVKFSVDDLSNEISDTAGLEKAKEIPSVNQQVVPEQPNYSDYINWRNALNLHYTNPFVTYAKQGSKLISRNPIWRFKSVNFRKVAQ